MDPRNTETRGWLFYDGECPLCRRQARRFGPLLARRGFALDTLQSERGRPYATGPDEMKFVTTAGEVLGGAAAMAYLAAAIWWAKPVAWLWHIPVFRGVANRLYRHIAARRHCTSASCPVRPPRNV